MTVELFTQVLGWACLINIGILCLITLSVTLFRQQVVKVHSALFGLDEDFLFKAYFDYLGRYKIMTLVFNLSPYIALRIVS